MPRTAVLTSLAMLAFAGNSLLCRAALVSTDIDPSSFTALRLFSGALVLAALVWIRQGSRLEGTVFCALALFGYAIAFSFAYLQLDAGSGALLLFGSVQACMLSYGWWRGERLNGLQRFGLGCAIVGLLILLLPLASLPALSSALLMLLAGVCWAIYSLLGRSSRDPLAATAGNFLLCVPALLPLLLVFRSQLQWDNLGAFYALLSGAITSGIGYALWYAALPQLKALQAASVQLSVPIIAALIGSLLLSEPLTPRLLVASLAVLGGIALVLQSKAKALPAP